MTDLPTAATCKCGYDNQQCVAMCSTTQAHCGCNGATRTHDEDCECTRCMRLGMEYLRGLIVQKDEKIKQLAECINAGFKFDLDGEG